MITHWDDVAGVRREQGHIAGTWYSLTGSSSVTAGVRRIRVDPGMWSTPLHMEGSEEEIFFVLEGDGVSVQDDGSGLAAYPIRPGDCLVHLPLRHAHTLRAGDSGLDVLAFGERHLAANTLLPRAAVSWLGPTWVLQGEPEDHPYAREAAVGQPAVGELSARPPRIVNLEEADEFERVGATVARRGRDLGLAAGSERTGIKLYEVLPGMLMNAPHSHSAEEEIFVVLEGSGTVEQWPHPRAAAEPERWPGGHEQHAVRAGHTIASPAGRGRPLSIRAGAEAMRVLAYGTREPNDIAYYPRSGKVMLRGVGVVGRLEQLDYWDGED
ncbi:MAG: cupin domain-containing protein [Gaiellaceae bacterium]